MTAWLNKVWYEDHPARWALYPFSLVFQGIITVRSWYLKNFRQKKFPVPIIVVGNINVGGVGKTPLVVELARSFSAKDYKVGIVSRGFQAGVKQFPYEVQENDQADLVGDEPLLLAKKAGCPVVIDPDRAEAVRYLCEKKNCNLIISDDGLQHYRMGRAIEIAVIDYRSMGNGLLLPAGPLREKISRLKTVDFIVANGVKKQGCYSMELVGNEVIHLKTGKVIPINELQTPIAAVAGLGNPQRFFNSLQEKGISFKPYPFKDHHSFAEKDFSFPEKIIVMTEKDAVKCTAFAKENFYFLPVRAELDNAFWEALWCHKQLQKK
ncbi:tetraacyldisaccharide 4'-kinase [Legionella adelaidensis]|uniref:tetraacyldisaccharide 4'-kinase n=1 Tax=Legionella adelaidensis TaxID=45056 RepID=UPI0007314D21|nr:tetraacyldisaccharide 4'-kinase [Legionella adelaidensis]